MTADRSATPPGFRPADPTEQTRVTGGIYYFPTFRPVPPRPVTIIRPPCHRPGGYFGGITIYFK